MTEISDALGWAAKRHWGADALCREVDAELFFPLKGEDAVFKAAKQVCDLCPVSTPCLEEALEMKEAFGVRGGMSPRQRHRLATDRRRANGTLGQRTCHMCGTLFPGGPNNKNCSTECEREARRRRARAAS